jgi:hypothetical protein
MSQNEGGGLFKIFREEKFVIGTEELSISSHFFCEKSESSPITKTKKLQNLMMMI